MSDTGKAIQLQYRKRLLGLKPEERVKMACRMFSTARALVKAGDSADINSASVRGRTSLFLKTYGKDFDAATRNRIIAQLR